MQKVQIFITSLVLIADFGSLSLYDSDRFDVL